MKKIVLVNNRGVALVDDEDFDRLSHFRWRAHRSKPDGVTYASTRILGRSGKRPPVYMHRMITGAKSGDLVDHRDGDGLNNRKKNLRLCTTSQNGRNSKPRTSHAKGVWLDKRRGTWTAMLTLHRKRVWLGSYRTEREAAKAYRDGAAVYFESFDGMGTATERK